MELKNQKSFWETAFDTRVAFTKVIIWIVAPIMLIIFGAEKIGEYNYRCMDKSLYKKSLQVEINNEKPIKLEKLDGYYALHFSENRILYSCNWNSSTDGLNRTYKMDDAIKENVILKTKGDNAFYIIDKTVKNQSFFFIEWTEFTGWR